MNNGWHLALVVRRSRGGRTPPLCLWTRGGGSISAARGEEIFLAFPWQFLPAKAPYRSPSAVTRSCPAERPKARAMRWMLSNEMLTSPPLHRAHVSAVYPDSVGESLLRIPSLRTKAAHCPAEALL
jgi:hypothetical protein